MLGACNSTMQMVYTLMASGVGNNLEELFNNLCENALVLLEIRSTKCGRPL
jgi:hypothetical protein